MLKRTIATNDYVIRKLFYVSIVRPILEYSSQLWSPYIKKNVYSIESVQRSASRFMLNYQDLTYHPRLGSRNLLPLVYRREFLDLVLFHKIISNKTPLNSRNYCIINVNERYDVRDASKLYIPFAKTNQYKYRYFLRVLRLWKRCQQKLAILIWYLWHTFRKES